jgi:hypothetical protein
MRTALALVFLATVALAAAYPEPNQSYRSLGKPAVWYKTVHTCITTLKARPCLGPMNVTKFVPLFTAVLKNIPVVDDLI